jgi:hypothetical protein
MAALSDAYAADRIELEELERRMARVYRATTQAALAEVMVDLSPHGPWSTPPGSAAHPAGMPTATDLVSARAWAYGMATQARAEVVPARQALVAIMGAVTRKGAWVVPTTLRVIAVMGGVDLDLREAHFGAGVTEIEVFAIMGGVDILVPTGVRVETTGMGIMGAFEITGADADPGPDAPVLRISGVATMAGVEAKLKRLRRS